MVDTMIDNIFVTGSNILRYLQLRQKEIKKSDKIKFAKPVGIEVFM